MKKFRLLYLILGIIVLGLVIILLGTNVFMDKPKEIVLEKESDRKVHSTGISMMLETNVGSGEYQETTDTTWAQAIAKGYIFNENMSKCENGSVLTWNETNKTVEFTGNVSDKCYVYFDVKKPTAVETITNLYTTDGAKGLYKHDGVGTYGEYEAGDNSYRYSGADPNNYVCFGTDVATCPTDNLYRIIGIFDGQMKLIKYDYATSDQLGTVGDYYGTGNHSSTYKGKQTTWYRFYWNKSGTNTWSESSLNTVNLNTNFKNYLKTTGGKDWATYIDGNKTWKVGGTTWIKIGATVGVKNVYTAEITNPATTDTVTAMFGLMYVSEYMYAADPTQVNAWSALMGYNSTASKDFRAAVSYNWMYMGEYDWAVSRLSDNSFQASRVHSDGNVDGSTVSGVVGVRPCFYLKPEVTLSSGSGTQSDPYRIA